MRNSLGKYLAYLRLENEEKVGDMAEKLEMSPSFLSNVERNRRDPPENTFEKITTSYKIKNKLELISAIAKSKKSHHFITTNPEERNILFLIAVLFKSVSSDKLEETRKVLEQILEPCLD